VKYVIRPIVWVAAHIRVAISQRVYAEAIKNLNLSCNFSNLSVSVHSVARDAGTGCITGALPPCLLIGGATGAQVPLHTSIISNFMIYQDQFEANLLQLFAHTYNSEWFSIIFVFSFEVNIVVKHVNAKRMTIMAIGVLLH